jgi:TRAP-type C4-dicarboxylate transport system substrate-binding protein
VELAAATLRSADIDAAVMDPAAATVFGVHREARWALADFASFTGTVFLLMNRERWDALPEDLKAGITESTGRTLACQAARAYRAQGQAVQRDIAAAKVEVSAPDASARADFERAAQRVRAAAVAKFADQDRDVRAAFRALEGARAQACEG